MIVASITTAMNIHFVIINKQQLPMPPMKKALFFLFLFWFVAEGGGW